MPLYGWDCAYLNETSGGRWFTDEANNHIYVLELKQFIDIKFPFLILGFHIIDLMIILQFYILIT